MELDRAMGLLGGLSPATFMRRHWQRRPLLVRSALPGSLPALSRAGVFALAERDDVESRLVVRTEGGRWSVRPGPIARRSLPPLKRAGWTLLVQGVDLHVDAAHDLLQRFRFLPDARLDDVMVSYASDGGGVGPHIDSYDVFLLQLAGQRRWRIGRERKPVLRCDVPLKMLAAFEPSEEWLLEAGDMLYLPPGWGHDGTAVGECLTASIGFRAPAAVELGAVTLQRLAEARLDDAPEAPGPRYRDRRALPTAHPARIPAALQDFADASIERLLASGKARRRALGEMLSEPKAATWFDRRDDAEDEGADGGGQGQAGGEDREAGSRVAAASSGVVVDRRTRMLYDDDHVFVNGESFRLGGRDAGLVRRLADQRRLGARAVAALSEPARGQLQEWIDAGWLHRLPGDGQNDGP